MDFPGENRLSINTLKKASKRILLMDSKQHRAEKPETGHFNGRWLDDVSRNPYAG